MNFTRSGRKQLGIAGRDLALFSGVQGREGFLGEDEDSQHRDCKDDEENDLVRLMQIKIKNNR